MFFSKENLILLLKKTPTYNLSSHYNKIISSFLTIFYSIPFSLFYKNESSNSSNSDTKWYTITWNNKVNEYKFRENDSDANNNIDKTLNYKEQNSDFLLVKIHMIMSEMFISNKIVPK